MQVPKPPGRRFHPALTHQNPRPSPAQGHPVRAPAWPPSESAQPPSAPRQRDRDRSGSHSQWNLLNTLIKLRHTQCSLSRLNQSVGTKRITVIEFQLQSGMERGPRPGEATSEAPPAGGGGGRWSKEGCGWPAGWGVVPGHGGGPPHMRRYSRKEALWWEEGSELPPLVAAPSGKGSDLTCGAKGCL